MSIPNKQPSFSDIMSKSGNAALQGGLAGGLAMGVNVLSLMWLRTTMNYQYLNGSSISNALQTLYKQGGIPRFYRGLAPALVQGPLSRFGDTAANTGMLSLWESYPDMNEKTPTFIKSLSCSAGAGIFRIFLMPIDTIKTTMQVQGSFSHVIIKLKHGGPAILYHGSIASATATFVGHYPWFYTYNLLNEFFPERKYDTSTSPKLDEFVRRAGIGFTSSVVSDTISNSIRVVKVFKQASTKIISYPTAARSIIAKDGLNGLFFRGLETKIFANGLQGILFSILWKQFEDMLRDRAK